MEISLRSYPKVNIGLYVSGRRDDGYHNIASVFQKIDCIYDVININIEESNSNIIEVVGLEDYVEQKNSTVYRACELWLEKKNKKYKVKICVNKNVPVRSGLGSPSSNAATVLIGLEMLTSEKTSESDLINIGKEIGSDVPFFLCSSNAAVVTSRGEVITPIKARTDIEFKLIKGKGNKVSTAEAYAQLDNRKTISSIPSYEELTKMYYSDIREWNFTNDFEQLYEKPRGFEKIMLTGSGTYWFTVTNKLT